MGFTPKDWINEADHAGPPASPPGTPISDASLTDLEVRVTDYAEITGGGIFNVMDSAYGATGDGTTDDTAAIEAAIDAATAAGGGVVYLPAPNTYAIASTLTLKSCVYDDPENPVWEEWSGPVEVVIPRGATLKWTGADNGTMIDNGNVPWIRGRFGGGGVLDANNLAGYVLNLHSISASIVDDFLVQNCKTTTVVCNVDCATTIGGGLNLRNSAFNQIGGFYVFGDFGKALRVTGGSASGGFFTDNTINSIWAERCNDTFIDIVDYADSNSFAGSFWTHLMTNNAIAVNIGGSVYIYGYTFDHVLVDAEGSLTNARGFVLGSGCKRITCRYFSGGSFLTGGNVVDNGCSSYEINGDDGASLNFIHSYNKGMLSDSDWQTPSMQSGWTEGTPAPKYRSDNGVVSMQGNVDLDGGTTGTVVFYLASGFTPSQTVSFPIAVAGQSPATAAVQTNGAVIVHFSAGTSFDLSGIRFVAELT